MNFNRKVRACLAGSVTLLVGACGATTPATSATVAVAAPAVSPAAVSPLTFATWNIEHLAASTENGCKPRTAAEIEALQAYARTLDADVIGLQEVDSIEAIALIFPESEWQLFLSDRPDSEPYTCRQNGLTSTQQKVGYAVRKGLEVTRVESLTSFGLDSRGLRYGLEIDINSDFGAISALNLHMKSGCFVDNFSRADSDACVTFSRQAPILDAWIEEKESDGKPYLVMGDFNHRLSAPYNHLTRLLTSNSDGSDSTLNIATRDIIGCHPYYPAPIDHILVGNMANPAVEQRVKVHAFDDMTVDNMLSDHCAISLTLDKQSLALSNAVKWQTQSKEYQFLTTDAYQRAAQTLTQAALPSDAWVVVMDVDETVLDNSEYQVRLNQTGTTYSPATWNAWVAEQQAGLVPGVASFMQSVVKLGGKFALVTNRDRVLDSHTWQNMQALGLPITEDNTCLIGRDSQDKDAINKTTILNDKDLRRIQITAGEASCYRPDGDRHSGFPGANIVMQVGDNIEDFTGITQEDADVEAIIEASQGFYVLLPNPMYGSW